MFMVVSKVKGILKGVSPLRFETYAAKNLGTVSPVHICSVHTVLEIHKFMCIQTLYL